MSEALDVSVIVPARNAAATIGQTLRALEAQSYSGDWEVIVVDSGSDDSTREIVTQAPKADLITRSGGWPGASRNLAARRARGRILAFTDADCSPTPRWLEEGVAALAGADLAQGAVKPDPNAPVGPFSRSLTVRGEALYETANLFVTKDLFQRIGGFEDVIQADLDRPFGEDVQLGWRARRSGAKTVFADRALVHHAVFDRDPVEFIRERGRLGNFAALVREVPELREAFFYKRYFLSRRTAELDLAALAFAGVATGRAIGAPFSARAAFALAAAPYFKTVMREALPHGRHAPGVAGVNVVADIRGAASLVRHSIKTGRLVI